MYIHIYPSLCKFIIRLYLYIQTHTHIYICIYIYIYTYIYIYMNVYIYIHMYLYMNVYIYICIYIYTHIYTYTCIYICINIHMFIYIYISIFICVSSWYKTLDQVWLYLLVSRCWPHWKVSIMSVRSHVLPCFLINSLVKSPWHSPPLARFVPLVSEKTKKGCFWKQKRIVWMKFIDDGFFFDWSVSMKVCFL